MKFLLDTNLVSELMRTPGDPAAIDWVAGHDQHAMHLSVVTIMELRQGIQLLPAGKKRQMLDQWIESQLPGRFADRVLVVDEQTADKCGRFSVIVIWYPTFDG